MKLAFGLCFSLVCVVAPLRAEVVAGRYDMASVRDPSTLETRVIEDWHPWGKDTGIRQKFIEITVCEWWPGQKVRLPVTLLAPDRGNDEIRMTNDERAASVAAGAHKTGGVCKYLVVSNSGNQMKAVSPSGAMLRLLKEGVGVALIGMTTVDAMAPAGLDVGMKEHFLKSKDARFTPAWIWGISDMRALTAAAAEKDVFQPVKVIATGGSKRGVATAAAGIADDRFTAIMPVVAPIIDPPGGPYVEGTRSAAITQANEQFLAEMRAGKIANVTPAGFDALTVREKARSDERITLKEARDAGWTDEEIKAGSTLAWEVCRATDYLPELQKRGVEIFYNEGSNDNVSPGLLAVCERYPKLPVFVVPGGQHGAGKAAGLTKPVGSLPEVDENLFAFAQHHFFNARPMVAAPKVTQHWDGAARKLEVTAAFPDKTEPQKNDLWWSVNRHPDYTLEMEYSPWQSVPMRQTGPGTFVGEVTLDAKPDTVDFVTVHRHTANGSTLTLSGPLRRIEMR